MTKRQRDDDDDAFDRHGVLRVGRSFRVPMTLMDESAPITDATGDSGLGLHRPGFRFLGGSPRDQLVRAVRDMRQEAYADYERDLCEQWKGPGR